MPVFQIAPLNPIRFVDPEKGRFDGTPASQPGHSFSAPKCYFQKWQTSDSTRLQILSSFGSFSFDIVDIHTGQPVHSVVPALEETTVIGHDFEVYEVPVDFSLVPEGEYQARITYENELEQEVELWSEPMEVREEHPDTLLFEYRNSDNNFSVVFTTDIVFRIRVEGVIENFTPSSDDIVYNDQKRNATLLDSIPYRVFTLFVGNAEGIPNWVADRVNRIMSCDIVAIDGEYYEKTEGASWDVNRADEYSFIGMTVEIMPVDNRFLEKFMAGEVPGEVTIVQKYLNYTNISGDMSITGRFRDMSLLEKISLVRTGAPFILRVGTTPGGDEVGEFEIIDMVTTITVNHRFTTDVTLYLSGITEVSSLDLIYKQLDEPPIPTGLIPPPGPSPTLGRGATIIWHFQDQDDLDENFNLTSGLGNEGTDWEGWAIADGRNGTIDMKGMFPLGFQTGEYELGTTGGEAEHTLTQAEMPTHHHGYMSTRGNLYKRGNTGSEFFKAPSAPEDFTEPVGGSQPHNNMPPYRVVLWVTKIA